MRREEIDRLEKTFWATNAHESTRIKKRLFVAPIVWRGGAAAVNCEGTFGSRVHADIHGAEPYPRLSVSIRGSILLPRRGGRRVVVEVQDGIGEHVELAQILPAVRGVGREHHYVPSAY